MALLAPILLLMMTTTTNSSSSSSSSYSVATPIPTTWRTPQIHFAPPCFSDAPPHDIAAAIFHPQTEEYHMFPGCWHSGGWQHIQSKDMVSWETVGKPTSLGGSGGVVLDEGGAAVAFANSVNAWISNSTSLLKFIPLGRLINQPGGGDPVIWKDERDSNWYAITANGRGGPAKNKEGCGVEKYRFRGQPSAKSSIFVHTFGSIYKTFVPRT
jgi:sucrose-6-phosphate hydrolase SacC (GH32 family)